VVPRVEASGSSRKVSGIRGVVGRAVIERQDLDASSAPSEPRPNASATFAPRVDGYEAGDVPVER